jgi:tRNA(fMet)-specific endonuclease VapC
MTYLLDTNACIGILRDQRSNISRRLMQESPGTVALCSVVKAELYYGAYKSQQTVQTLAKLTRFIRIFHSYAFDNVAAERQGYVRANLGARGTPIGPNDLMIAAIALANNLILVTHNTRECARVAGLTLEDWA